MTGPEHNVFWERLDDGSREGYAELRPIREQVVSVGEAVCMKTGEIHSVENRSDEMTLSLHIYGRHLNYTGRSQFDIELNREIPFLIETR
jgi:predicted metal-dependent enzyme (double-stranded beta helix superfamily)